MCEFIRSFFCGVISYISCIRLRRLLDCRDGPITHIVFNWINRTTEAVLSEGSLLL